MRVPFVIAVVLGLAACTPTVPNSAPEAGPGFQDYNSYLRDQELQRTQPAPVMPLPGTGGAFSPDAAAAAIDRAEGVAPSTFGAAPLPGSTLPGAPVATAPLGTVAPPLTAVATDPGTGVRARGNAPAGIQEENGEMVHSNSGISDEQDFNAVAARETIESDAERIARNKAQYTEVAPVAVPDRPRDTGPNIVEFALSTTHAPGTQVYSRTSLRVGGGSACNRYASPDLAQEAFLEKGGPDKDRAGLDPDGDGFACSWDPRPFRTALQ